MSANRAKLSAQIMPGNQRRVGLQVSVSSRLTRCASKQRDKPAPDVSCSNTGEDILYGGLQRRLLLFTRAQRGVGRSGNRPKRA